jgi:hypothetical protein
MVTTTVSAVCWRLNLGTSIAFALCVEGGDGPWTEGTEEAIDSEVCRMETEDEDSQEMVEPLLWMLGLSPNLCRVWWVGE